MYIYKHKYTSTHKQCYTIHTHTHTSGTYVFACIYYYYCGLLIHMYMQVVYSSTLPRLPAFPVDPWPTEITIVGSGFNFPVSQYKCRTTMNGQTIFTEATSTATPQHLVCKSPVFSVGTIAGNAVIQVLLNNVALPALTSSGAGITVEMFPVFLGISSCSPAQSSKCSTQGGPGSGGHGLVLLGKNLDPSLEHLLRFTAGSNILDVSVSSMSTGGVITSLPPWPHFAGDTNVTLMRKRAGMWEEIAANDTFTFEFTQTLSGANAPQKAPTCEGQGVCWPRTIQVTGGGYDLDGPTQRLNFGAAMVVGHLRYTCRLISALGDGDLFADYVILDSGSSLRCVFGSSGNPIMFTAQSYTVQVNYSGTEVPYTPAANKVVSLSSSWDIVTLGSCYSAPCPTSATGGGVLELQGHGFKLNESMGCAFWYNGVLTEDTSIAEVVSQNLVSARACTLRCDQCNVYVCVS
jgi:hypothetical protein